MDLASQCFYPGDDAQEQWNHEFLRVVENGLESAQALHGCMAKSTVSTCFNTCKAVKCKDHQGPLSWDVLGCQS